MAFQLGETYSGYKFLDVVKRTKTGVEYRVQNTCAQRLEILRALPPSANNDQEQTERFLRELRVRARLVHPNIVTLFNAVELDRQLVMTTELVEGPTLAERLLLGPLPIAEARALMYQALTAVGFAHEQRVIHRDINPENIVVTADGVLKLANFAAAKSTASPKLTQVGTIVGNLKYISPEQVKGIAEADPRSDLYSLGIVFYEMVCGRPPFVSDSQFELMAGHVNLPPPPPSFFNASTPPGLDAIILKAIAKDPEARYQSAEEFAHAIAAQAGEASVVPVAKMVPRDPPLAHALAVRVAEASTAVMVEEELPVLVAQAGDLRPAAMAAEEVVPAAATAVLDEPATPAVQDAAAVPVAAVPAPAFLTTPPAPAPQFSLLLCSAAMFVGLLLVVFWFAGR